MNTGKAEIVVSIVALILSSFSLWYSTKKNKDIANKEFEHLYFDRIFSDFILDGLPNLFFIIKMGRYTIESYESKIMGIIDAMTPYKYTDRNFFDETYNLLIKLEDMAYKIEDSESLDLDQLGIQTEKIVEEIYIKLKRKYSC